MNNPLFKQSPGYPCCCCQINFEDQKDGVLIINDIQHEIYGVEGNFCGPVDKHTIRDLEKEVERHIKFENDQGHEMDDLRQRLIEAEEALCENFVEIRTLYDY